MRRLALALIASIAALPAQAQLGIDLSSPSKPEAGSKAKAQPAKPPAPAAAPAPAPAPSAAAPSTATPTPGATPTPTALPTPGAPPTRTATPTPSTPTAAPTGPTPRLADVEALAGARKHDEAALAADAILRDASAAASHPEARLLLAESLSRLGLVRSATSTFGDLIAAAPSGTQLERAADALLDLATRTGDEHTVVAQVARLKDAALPAAAEDRLHYLLAKYTYDRAQALEEAGRKEEAKKALDEARRLAGLVRRADAADRADVFARARFVDGLAQYAQGNGPGALEAFKEVVRLTNPRRAAASDGRLRELAFLQLARLHYEHRQNRYAIFYYGRMPQAGESWLEGLWESSYAYYRIGDYERALGNLITLHSPYFQDEWFPESHLLKAIIYYENCRYPEARAILEEFGRRFEPVHAALARAASRPGEPAAFLQATVAGGGETDPALARRVTKLALADGVVKRLTASIGELEREAGAGIDARPAAFRGSALARSLRERLAAEREALAVEAGARVRHQLSRQRDELRGMLEQALRIKIEVSRREREALEATIARRAPASVLRDYRYSAAVSDEHLYWPYDGEFWRDELGTYAYTLTKGCRDAPGDVQASR